MKGAGWDLLALGLLGMLPCPLRSCCRRKWSCWKLHTSRAQCQDRTAVRMSRSCAASSTCRMMLMLMAGWLRIPPLPRSLQEFEKELKEAAAPDGEPAKPAAGEKKDEPASKP